MKKLSLFVTLGLIALIGSLAPVNAAPQGDSLETSEQNYIIYPETGAVIEETEDLVGEGAGEVMIEEDAAIIEPGVDAASETGEEAPAQ